MTRPQEDRVGLRAYASGVYVAKCDGCPEAAELLTWKADSPPLGCFTWRPDDTDDHKPTSGCSPGIPDLDKWIARWTELKWNAGWYCTDCCMYIFDVAPSTIQRLMATSTQYPAVPRKRPKAQRQLPGEGSLAPAHGGPFHADAALPDGLGGEL